MVGRAGFHAPADVGGLVRAVGGEFRPAIHHAESHLLFPELIN
jgi:hypothetical protein